MATLALAAVGSMAGAAVGGSVGASVGWLIGSMLGNLLFPQKVEGPRRSDLKLQAAEYGKPIPWVRGTGRLAGNVIDQTDLQEHKQTSGGKGGPQVTNYTYSASFAILICSGPIVGVRRIWADGRLIWSSDTDADAPCEIYLGDEDQDPDPTLEAIHGVGTTPAYRGLAYVVFTDYMLTDFGDRIPLMEFEVYTNAGEIPWRVSTFNPWGVPLLSNFYHAAATYRDGVITTVEMGNGSDDNFVIRKWHTDGTEVASEVTQACPVPGTESVFAVTNRNIFMRGFNTGDGINWFWLYYNESTDQIETGYMIAGGTISGTYIGAPMVAIGGYIYAVGHTGFDWIISRFANSTGTGGPLVDSAPVYTGDSGFSRAPSLGTTNEVGVVYAMWEAADGHHLRKYDANDLTLIHEWTPSDIGSLHLEHSGITFHVHNGIICN